MVRQGAEGVPRSITQYRVFIASPGGLEAERECFRKRLEKCSRSHGEQHEVQFHPVGWEDTLGGAGRPQEQINEDLRQCDYALFVLHDRWGSPTGNGHTSGTEEEWNLAEQLYTENKIRNIILCFKVVDPSRLKDPGEQLKSVVTFKQKIENERKYLFKSFQTIDEFGELIDSHLARWLKEHVNPSRPLSADPLLSLEQAPAGVASAAAEPGQPGFAFWLAEAKRLKDEDVPEHAGVLFCATKAQSGSASDGEWTQAVHAKAIALYELGRLEEAATAFGAIADRLIDAPDADMKTRHARALFNKGVMLGAIDRGAEEIAAYDDLISRFADDPAPALRAQVAKALINKGVRLGVLDRSAEEIAAYDDLISRFADDPAPTLREQVAKGLFNKGFTLGVLHRSAEEIAAYDDLIARFADDPAPVLREQVANALLNKGFTLGALDRGAEAIAAYDDLIARFADDPAPVLREQIAKALINKGVRLGALDREAEEIAAYDDLIDRFAGDPAPALRDHVATALFNKGVTLGALDRDAEEIAAYDDLIDRFADDPAPALREHVATALFNKGVRLGALDRGTEAIVAYDDLIDRFAGDPAPDIQEIVSEAKTARDALSKS